MPAGDKTLNYLGNGLKNEWVVAFLGQQLDQAAESPAEGVLESLDMLVEATPNTQVAAEALDQTYCSLHQLLETNKPMLEQKQAELTGGAKGMLISMMGIGYKLERVFSSLNSLYELLGQRVVLEDTAHLRGGTGYAIRTFTDQGAHMAWYAAFSRSLDEWFNALASLARNKRVTDEIKGKIGEQQIADLIEIDYMALPQDISTLKSRIQGIIQPTELFLIRRAYR